MWREPRADPEAIFGLRPIRHLLRKRTSRQYLRHAWQLYDWLIRPLEVVLPAEVTTLVFVPDGPLRHVPMAALHDRERFLIEKYAVATTPGLELVGHVPYPMASCRY